MQVKLIAPGLKAATGAASGPVFNELPANPQLFAEVVGELPRWQPEVRPAPAKLRLKIATGADCQHQIDASNDAARIGQPVIVEVAIDDSKRTAFTEGVFKADFHRFTLTQKARAVGRAVLRKVTG
ncbi:MAG: hypothetical protein IPP87_23145 [Ideonella sp.]|nr:hypothetical protein [Ideonella sp.]